MIQLKLLEGIDYNYYQTKFGIEKGIIDYLLAYDPTKEKKFARFIVDGFAKLDDKTKKTVIAGGSSMDTFIDSDLEEHHISLGQLQNGLTLYSLPEVQKFLPQDKKDILKFKTWSNFLTYVHRDMRDSMADAKDKQARKESQIIFENAEWIFLKPKTHLSSCQFGDKTNWCTSREDDTNYYNQYSKKGTMFILRHKNEEGKLDPYSISTKAIQIYIPNDDVKELAECRNGQDMTIYASRLFEILPDDIPIIKYLEEKWDSLPNTDQWPEGTGYLDPTVLHPQDEEEENYEDEDDEEDNEEDYEEKETLIRTDTFIPRSFSMHPEWGGFIVFSCHIVKHTAVVDGNGNEVRTLEPVTMYTLSGNANYYSGEHFFTTSTGKNLIKELVISGDVDGTEDDITPSFYSNTLVVEYESRPYSYIKDSVNSNYTVDGIEVEDQLPNAQDYIEKLGGIHTIIFIYPEEYDYFDHSEEPIYQDLFYDNLNSVVIDLVNKKENSSHKHRSFLEKDSMKVRFVGGGYEQKSKIASIVFYMDAGYYYPLLKDELYVKKLLSGEFIQDRDEEGKAGQKFLDLEGED